MLAFLLPFPFFVLAIVTAGVSVGAAIFAFESLSRLLHEAAWPAWLHYPALGVAVAASFYVYGFVIILVAPTLNFLFRAKLKAWRGPAVSFGCLKWYVHSVLTVIVRFTFLDFASPTAYNLLFYRLMGMKIGRNVMINTTAIADPSLIELEDRVTIGGSASLIGHYAQGGYMILAPVRIRAGATIGLRAVIMGGVEVGEKAKVLANSFVLPNTKIPAGETWGGVPAQKIDLSVYREPASTRGELVE